MEKENNDLKEDNDSYKTNIDELQFKLQVLYEKDKINEQSQSNFKELQKNYEFSINELKKEYQNKEYIIMQKANEIEKETSSYFSKVENENKSQIDSLNSKLNEAEKTIEKVISSLKS